MATDIVVPQLGESVTEATVAKWLKSAGDPVKVDDPLVELETDKVTLEVYATAAGSLSEIRVAEGQTVEVGAVLGQIGEAGAAPAAAKPEVKAAVAEADAKKPAAEQQPGAVDPQPKTAQAAKVAPAGGDGPAVRKLAAEQGIDTTAIAGSGKDGRVTKGDVLGQMEKPAAPAAPAPAAAPAAPAPRPASPRPTGPREERVRMTRLRKRIAERLKQAQNTAAMLTTFNEVDMTNLLAVRERYKDAFEKKHGVKLGFMSFFAKACIVALKEIPAVNGEIDGDDIVYKNYYDIGVAVGTEQGLVVPVVRDVDSLSFGEIEAAIAALGRKARDGKLSIDELTGGTFTISNGGV